MTALASASPPDFAREIVARATSAGSSAAQARVVRQRELAIKFSQRGVELVRSTENETTSLDVYRDGRKGSATFTGREGDDIDSALAAALQAATAGVPDPAHDVADVASGPPTRHGPDAADRDAMMTPVEDFIDLLAREHPLIRARDCEHSFTDRVVSLANSRGLAQSERRAGFGLGVGLVAKDGARSTSMTWSYVGSAAPLGDFMQAGDIGRALLAAERSLDTRPVPETFVGDVIIAPLCLASLLHSYASALSGAALFAGTSPFKDSKGTKIASETFSLLNRPRADIFAWGSDFDGFGVPTQDIDVIRDGVLNEFLVDFFYARKLGLKQTAGATNFFVPPGSMPLADIVAGTKRGILFERFSGGNPNDNLDFSGIAKNSFLIEDGRVGHALSETMVSGNMRALFANIGAISREQVNFGGGAYPFVKAGGVTISSK